MNIAVNTRLLISGKLEGLGRFTFETLKRITLQHPEHHFIFIFDRPFSDEFIFSNNITPVICQPPARHPILWYLYFDWGIPRILKKYKADLFFSPDGWLSLRTNIPQIPVIHDLNFFHNPKWVDTASRKYYNYFFPKFIKKAVKIATVSEFTKQDIIKRFNTSSDVIDVVYNGCSEGFIPISEENKNDIKNKYTKGEEFFLFLGLVHPRKNLARTIEAFTILKKTDTKLKLLIIGDLTYITTDVRKAIDNSDIKNDIVFTGRMPESELKKILASAKALLYVSLFEGFGIPIIEAMHCNIPVITSNTSSMPEVGGDAVAYINPYSVESIVEGMLKVNSNNEFRTQLLEKTIAQRNKFSWDNTANAVWKTLESTML